MSASSVNIYDFILHSFDKVVIVVICLSSYIVQSFCMSDIALVIYFICSSLSNLANNSMELANNAIVYTITKTICLY